MVYATLVQTEFGQRLENLALAGASFHRPEDLERSLANLSQISVLSFALAIAVVTAAALIRRRVFLGALVAVVMVVSVIVAEILKELLPRPELVTGPGWLLRNSFPSGHATVAAAIGVAALLVAPDRLRWIFVPAAAVYASLIGQATQIAGWHRLSGAIGGVLIVIIVGSVALMALSAAGLVTRSESGRVHPGIRALLKLTGAGATLLGLGIAGLPAAFPLLVAPEGADSVFLHTSFDLLGIGFTTLAILGFAALIEPFSLGRQPSGPPLRGLGQGEAPDEWKVPSAEAPVTDDEADMDADVSGPGAPRS